MAVQMVRRNVEHDGDVRMEALDGLQLEAADLQHDPVSSGAESRRNVIAGVPMLPPTSALRPPAARISPARVVVVVLPFEPVMATMFALQKSRRQLDFADHGNAERARLHQLRHVERNARADDDQVLIAKCALAVLAGFNADAVVEQQQESPARSCSSDLASETATRAPLLRKKQSAGNAGLAQSDHQHAFAFDVHHSIHPAHGPHLPVTELF